VQFKGFKQEDFEIFAIPDFPGRMGAIRAELRPKLVALGDDLAGKVEKLLGVPAFPHAAQHMRRRVNPPAETWVAFGPERRGYKRWVHYRVAISESRVRVTVFLEDDADDKPQLGANLHKNAANLITELGSAPVEWYTFGGDLPLPHSELTPQKLSEAGSALQRLKTSKFQAGIALDRKQVTKLTPARFQDWALEQMSVLKPLYLAAGRE
jgi:uncharacterized protein YktB (UPF0637 family)